jgi:hypothetical protein
MICGDIPRQDLVLKFTPIPFSHLLSPSQLGKLLVCTSPACACCLRALAWYFHAPAWYLRAPAWCSRALSSFLHDTCVHLYGASLTCSSKVHARFTDTGCDLTTASVVPENAFGKR